MMEKITIKSIVPKVTLAGVNFWACMSENNSPYTVWDKTIAEDIGKNLHVECEAEVKQSGEYWNIRKFVPGCTTAAPSVPTIPNREKSIVAQCLTKVVYGAEGGRQESVLETYKFFLEKL